MSGLSHTRLLEVLMFDPETGVFTRLVSPNKRYPCGEVAGGASGHRYARMAIDGQRYLVHRLAWFYVHGVWPIGYIDHINGKRTDNRIANLREATPSQNISNSKLRCDNKSGVKGVSWNSQYKCWVAQLKTNGAYKFLGRHSTIEAAAAAYAEASKAMNGEFANLG